MRIQIIYDTVLQNNYLSIILFILFGYILSRIYEVFFMNQINRTLPFFKEENSKQVMFGVFIIAIILFITTLILGFLYKAHFMWYVLSSLLMFGSILGMLPYGFKKRN